MSAFTIRPGLAADEACILALADRLAAFGPRTRSAAEISSRERRALAEALAHPSRDSALLVADHAQLGITGILLLESRRDYFTDDVHGHVAILVVAQEVEGQGLGRRLLEAAEEWGRAHDLRRLTLTVFTDNQRAKEFYRGQGWRPELETYFKNLGLSALLTLSAALSAGCGLLGPGTREFVIQVDSIAGPTAVPGNAAFQQFFYGGVGPDGCHQFKEFRVARGATTADITVVGEESRGGGDCTTLAVYMRGEPLTLDPPISDPFTLRVHQRDGSVLTRIFHPD